MGRDTFGPRHNARVRLSTTLRCAAVAAVCLLTLSAAPAHAEGQLRIGVLEEIGTLNPYATGNATEEQLWALVYDTLVTRSRKTLEPDPDRSLARGWTVTDGGKRWTFKLASDVRWSDGDRFTAADVVYSMRLAAEPGSPFAGALRNVRSWRAPDSLTVEAALSQRVPDLDRLPVPIVPAHIWRRVPRPLVASLDAPLVVTGPYYVSTHDSIGRTVLARNPDFRHVNTGPDRVVFLRYRDASELAPALERGEIDVAHLTAASQAAAISPIPGVRTYRALAPSVTFLVFDERTDDARPAVGDPALRKALGLAIDRDKLVERALGGLGQPGTFGLLPPFYGAASSDLSRDRRLPLAYDRARARAVLDSAGWHTALDGVRMRDGVRASLVLSVQADRPSDLRTAVLLEQMARHVGIEIRLNLLGPAVLSRGRDMPDDQVAQADASLVTVRGEPTPDSLLAAFASRSSDPLNAAHWGDARL